METITPIEATTRLREAAMSLTEAALNTRRTQPRDTPIFCMAVVMDATGQQHLVAIGNPKDRHAALHAVVRHEHAVGFALLFDGYISREQPSGAPDPKYPRMDALIAVVRTVWGTGATLSVAYHYPGGAFTLCPERNEEQEVGPGLVDTYGTIFQDAVVN